MKPILAKPPQISDGAFQVWLDLFDYLDTPWHFHEEYELTLITYPGGQRLVGNNIDTFIQQDLVLLGPNLPHAWKHREVAEVVSPKATGAIVIHFRESCLGESFFRLPDLQPIHNVLQKSRRGLALTGEIAEQIGLIMHQMLTSDNAQRIIQLLSILHLISQTSPHQLLATDGYWEEDNPVDSARMNDIHAYIMNHFTRDISLNEMAELAHMSTTAFCRYFKLRTRRTLKTFVNELRVNYACKLLHEEAYSITQIGYEAGFNNQSNFNRRFKEIKAVTPRQYRQTITRSDFSNSF